VCSHLTEQTSQHKCFKPKAHNSQPAYTFNPCFVSGAQAQERRGKESGHKQMLGQAAAMLVSLPTLLAAELGSVAPLDEGLAVAGSPDAGILVPFITRHVVELIINGTVLHVGYAIGRHKLMSRHAGRWRWQAARQAGS
jgi:hypothetical protein